MLKIVNYFFVDHDGAAAATGLANKNRSFYDCISAMSSAAAAPFMSLKKSCPNLKVYELAARTLFLLPHKNPFSSSGQQRQQSPLARYKTRLAKSATVVVFWSSGCF